MPELTSQQLSDLFRWMDKYDRLGFYPDNIDQICSLIEGKSSLWQDEWREYQASLPDVGIGMNPTFQG